MLNWEEGIGSWRLNRTDDIKFPPDESLLTLRENRPVEIHEPRALPIELSVEDE